MSTFATLLLSVLPVSSEPVRDYVDMMEVQTMLDEQFRPTWTQLIFWTFDYHKCRYQVLAWRMVKEPNHRPHYDHRAGVYRATFMDGDLLRVVESTAFRETETQVDTELAEREHIPIEKRRGLSKSVVSPIRPSDDTLPEPVVVEDVSQ